MFTYTPLKFFVQSFWRDEAFSYVLASKGFLEILALTARDFNPPLYYLVLNIWMKIFGTSEVALRSLSFIFFWATLYVVFLFFYQVMKLSYKKSVFYLGLFIINPFLIYYAFEARMYTMLTFFAALSFYMLFTKQWKGYILATVLGLYVHYFMVLVIASQLFYLILTAKKRELLPIVKIMAIPVILFLPWAAYVMSTNVFLNSSFWITSVPFKTLLLLPGIVYTGFDTNLNDKNVPILSLLFLTLVSLTLTAIAFRLKRKDPLFILFLVWAFFTPLVIYLVSFYKPLFLPRYFVFTVVGMLMLFVYAIEQLQGKIKIICIVILSVLTMHHMSLALNYRHKDNMAKVLLEIKSLARDTDVVYVTDILDFSTAQYYFDPDRVYIYNKIYDEIPAYVGKALIPEDRLKYQYPVYPDKAFVLQEDGRYDIRAIF